MSHKGLTTDQVVKTAAELIEHSGRSGFSMRQLAAVLGVKAASLYTHLDSMDALLSEVCRYAMHLQMDAATSPCRCSCCSPPFPTSSAWAAPV